MHKKKPSAIKKQKSLAQDFDANFQEDKEIMNPIPRSMSLNDSGKNALSKLKLIRPHSFSNTRDKKKSEEKKPQTRYSPDLKETEKEIKWEIKTDASPLFEYEYAEEKNTEIKPLLLTVSNKEAYKEIFKIAAVTAGTEVVIVFNAWSMGLLLSNYSEDLLSASIVIQGVQTTFLVVLNAPLFYIAADIGRINGKEIILAAKLYQMGKTLKLAWSMASVISTINFSLMVALPYLLPKFGQPDYVVDEVRDYFYFLKFATPAIHLTTATQMFFYGKLEPIIPFLSSLVDTILFTSLGYVMTYDYFDHIGGAKGLGLARLVSAWTAFLFILLNMVKRNDFITHGLLESRKKKLAKLYLLLKNGLPIMVNLGGELGTLFVTVMFVGNLGREPLAIEQIASQFRVLAIAPILGLNQAICAKVSNSLESKINIKRYVKAAIAQGLITNSILSIILIPLYRQFASLFTNGSDSPLTDSDYQTLLWVLVVSAAFNSADVVRSICTGALRGMGITVVPMINNTASLWLLGVTTSYLYGFTLNGGILGINGGVASGLLLAAILDAIKLHNEVNKVPSAKKNIENKQQGRKGKEDKQDTNVQEDKNIEDLKSTPKKRSFCDNFTNFFRGWSSTPKLKVTLLVNESVETKETITSSVDHQLLYEV